jgi:endoglucanase
MPSSFLLGVNLAGAEFGSNVPGAFGTDYTYPTHAEIDYYASKGLSVIRLPFLWERIQHTMNGSLDAAELGRLDDVVSYTTGKGLKIEIEPHNYGYGFGALIGSAQTPNSAFADVWGKLALHFKTNSDVIFGLINEPHDQSAGAWLGSANAAIAAIRNAGAVQEILVPGSYWDGAWTWTSTDNAAVIGSGVQDPAHNFAFEVHQYLDADGSGTHSGVVSATIGVERLTAITQWAEANGKHLFLGEVGVTTDQTSLTALDGMLTYMQQHTGAWQGATYWAGGPWWGNYMFSIEPQNGIDKPQMATLVQHLALTGSNLAVVNLSMTDTSINYRVNNIGASTAAASIAGIYLSTDSTITISDTLLATKSTSTLSAGTGEDATGLLPLPTNLTAGTFYIGVIADCNGQITESNEADNASNGVAIILGNDSNNTLNGTSGNDTILGFDGNDLLGGLGGDDVLIPGHGNDILDGGDGFNFAYYSRPSAGYGVLNYQGQLYVGNPTDGLDTLINIQAINFEDASASRVGSGLDYIASYSDLIKAFGANETAGARHFLDHGWAEGRTIPFNGLDYIASYGDLIRAFGANEQAGATHFIDNGFNEGRHVTFNGLDYVASYGDLIRAFGANEQAGATHYIEHGLNEGRNVTFNGLDYIASYGDLIRAFGANEQAGATHYINHGFNEGRHVAFNGLEYIASYGDLIRAFGANEQVGATHYIEHGFNEGRGANLFDPEAYLTKYPDLRAAFGHDDHAATVHWIMHGFYEGRDWHLAS